MSGSRAGLIGFSRGGLWARKQHQHPPIGDRPREPLDRGGRDRWRGGRPWVVASVLILPAGRRGGEEEEGFCSFARDETEFGQAWNLGCFAYPVRLNLETISPTGFDLGSVGFELRKHRKVKELS